jgi:hypothetical protein
MWCALALSAAVSLVSSSALSVPAAAPAVAVVVRASSGAAEAHLAVTKSLTAAGVPVVERARSERQFEEALSFGLRCPAMDDACAAAFAQMAGVPRVLLLEHVTVAGAVVARGAYVDNAPSARQGGGRADDVGITAALALALVTGAPLTLLQPMRIVVSPPDAVVSVDGAAVIRHDGVAWLTPGPHRVEARQGAAVGAVAFELGTSGAMVELSALAQQPVEPGAAQPSDDRRAPPAPQEDATPALMLWAGAGASVGIGMLAWGFAELALSNRIDLEERMFWTSAGLAGVGLTVAGVTLGAVATQVGP